MSYIGVPPFGQTVRTLTELTASAAQAVFNISGGYLPGYIDVFLNGSSLASSDFTATNGTTVTLLSAAAVGDEFKAIAYWPVSLVDTYRKAEAVAKTGDTMTGNLTVPQWVELFTDGVAGTQRHGRISGTAADNNPYAGGVKLEFFNYNGSAYQFFDGLKVDGAGRVTTPYQPAFMAYNPDGQFVSGNLAFNSTRVNIGNCYNPSNGRFTAPVSGMYLISFDGLVDNNSFAHGHILINGLAQWGNEFYQASDLACISKQIIWNMSVGDYASVSLDSPSRVHQRYGSFNAFLIG